MSLKPPKKSDLKKGWLKHRSDKEIKLQPEYHLIITEGTDTEPAYFLAIKEVINRQYPGKIQLNIFGEGDNTINLFVKAKQVAGSNSNIYRHVWILYDTDDFPPTHIEQVVQLCQKNSTDETEYHALWSNQCFELWFLLHFSFMQSDIHRTEYWSKLSTHLTQIGKGEYTKNRKDMYHILRPFLDIAIVNAKKLNTVNAGKSVALSAPGTKVYELLEVLRPYL